MLLLLLLLQWKLLLSMLLLLELLLLSLLLLRLLRLLLLLLPLIIHHRCAAPSPKATAHSTHPVAQHDACLRCRFQRLFVEIRMLHIPAAKMIMCIYS